MLNQALALILLFLTSVLNVSADNKLIRRGLPGPGEPLKSYDVCWNTFMEKAERHDTDDKPEKAASARYKAFIVQSEDIDEMRAMAAKHEERYKEKVKETRKMKVKKDKASTRRRAYWQLMNHVKEGKELPWSCEDTVKEIMGNRQVYEDEPQRTWQKNMIRARHITGASLRHFNLMEAERRKYQKYREKADLSPEEEAHRLAKLDKIKDKFKAINDVDPEANRRLALLYKDAIGKYDDDVEQLKKEAAYYLQKQDAWKELADDVQDRQHPANQVYNMHFPDFYAGDQDQSDIHGPMHDIHDLQQQFHDIAVDDQAQAGHNDFQHGYELNHENAIHQYYPNGLPDYMNLPDRDDPHD